MASAGGDVGTMEAAIAAAIGQLVRAATFGEKLTAVVVAELILTPAGAPRWRVRSWADHQLTTPTGRLYHDASAAIEKRAREEGVY